MSSSPSLRDLYIDPSSAWSFLPSAGSNSSNVPPSSLQPEPVAPAYQWSTRPAHNSIFDISPDLDLSEPSRANATRLAKALVASAVLQYSSTAIVMPWEVGKLLLQVQWVPRDTGEPEVVQVENAEEDNEDALSDTSNDNEAYFADPNAPPTPRTLHRTDEQGYVIRRSVLEEGTRPEYIIPVGRADGVFEMMKGLVRFRHEGWYSLWKGLFTSCLTEILSSTLQPFLDAFLQSLFFPSMSPFHQPPLILPVASHLITGFILSPLDLIRTRLIVQPFSSRFQRYSGPLDAFRQIARDEGGLKGMYLHPQLLIPTLLDNALRPIVSLALPGMIISRFTNANITEDTHPRVWSFAEFAGSCVGLFVTLPIETIRRRLQVQVRGTAEPMKGCVELRPKPYNGVVDAFWHILTEERSDLPIRYPTRPRRMSTANAKDQNEEEQEEPLERESWSRNSGLGQLYRGLGMRLGASAIIFVLALWSGGEEIDSGWTEI
ncbi:mitochondrial carrier [Coprinopsis marcescibilis]|uniref:Mitochondrial carrier n=1 Tax=Coprinopsis marcescibilis TaxID=230819 RepID=A0A5C3LBF1_COPMA|nr:mitochondrial carrier [Coprinopsis marcescibilis]